MKKVLSRALASARKLWAKEPARVVSVATSAIVFVAATFGVIVPTQSVASAVAFAVPLLLGGELIRSQVTPTATPAAPQAPKA